MPTKKNYIANGNITPPFPDLNLKEWRGKRIFLTGGTGLFGKWLLFQFMAMPDTEVVVLSRNPVRFCATFGELCLAPNISFVSGDIRSFDCPSGSFDYLIHAATEASAKLESEQPEEMFSVIVDGTRHVLDIAKKTKVKRMLYISSGGVYGPQPSETSQIPETMSCKPVTSYGTGKRIAEQMCVDSGIDTVIARCFAFVGPHLPLDTHFAIGNFIGNCIRNEIIEIKGDGTPLRSYMYGSDLVEWLLRILESGSVGRCYNVGSDQAISIEDLAHRVREIAGTENKIIVHETPVSSKAPARYIPAICRAQSELDLTVKVNLRDAISQTLKWYR